jgi:UDP-glucose 4-epimerase
MKVLVTGGSGFIASHVVDQLKQAGHTPVIFDVRPSPYPEHADIETVLGDLLCADTVLRAAAGCDAIAHLAASADVGIVAKHPREADELNVRGTLNVLEAARETGARVLYASTIWAYSDVVADEVDEDTGLALPSHFYTATKVAGEMYCRSYRALYDVSSTILRFGIPYGPRARPAAVLPIFVNKALAGEPLTIAGDGRQTRRFVYVEDIARGVVAALAPVAADRVYNLVGEEDTSVRDIADAVAAAVGEVEVVHTPGRDGDFAGARVSGARAEIELGWTAATPFAEGVAQYVAWHRANPAVDTPATAAEPAVVAAATDLHRARHLSWIAARVAIAVFALLGYIELLQVVDIADDASFTVSVVTAVGVICTLATRAVRAWLAWGAGAVLLLPLLHPDLAHDVGLARLDVALLTLGAAGAGLALALVGQAERATARQLADEAA